MTAVTLRRHWNQIVTTLKGLHRWNVVVLCMYCALFPGMAEAAPIAVTLQSDTIYYDDGFGGGVQQSSLPFPTARPAPISYTQPAPSAAEAGISAAFGPDYAAVLFAPGTGVSQTSVTTPDSYAYIEIFYTATFTIADLGVQASMASISL